MSSVLAAAASAVNSGFHLAYLICAGLVLVAIRVAISVLRSPAPEAAAEPATAGPAMEAAAPREIQATPLPMSRDSRREPAPTQRSRAGAAAEDEAHAYGK
jgi:hypothetical protein